MVDENRGKSMARSFTASDAGCYVDGSRGIYATEAIVAFANDHGATIRHDVDCCTPGIGDLAGCDWIVDYEDKADDYMNDNYPVGDHYWGRQDGDWGLWQLDNDDN